MPYATATDVNTMFGRSNVRKWADMDGDGFDQVIDAAVTQALTFAEAEVNSRLRGGPYTVPFTDTVPVLVQEATTILAGLRLYEKRGMDDENDLMERKRVRANSLLQGIIQRKFVLEISPVVSAIPKVIENE